MSKYLVPYAAIVVVIVALDMLWLGLIAKSLYRQGIGHLMADEPRLWVAALFYVLYAIGLMLFAVVPGAVGAWTKTALMAGLFGFFAYATYDLSNLATLKQWPAWLALVDIAWGVVVSVAAGLAGRWAMGWFAAPAAAV